MKIYLNNEISRLKADLSEARKINEIKEDKEMLSKLNEVIKKLDSYSSTNIDDGVLLTVLKTQNLTKEIFSNAVDN